MGAVAEFAKKYMTLEVKLTPATVERTGKSKVYVRVRKYKNYNHMDEAGPELTAKARLWTLWSTDPDPARPQPPAGFLKSESFMAVFAGVAAPQEISFVLSIVAHYAATKKKPFDAGQEIGLLLQGFVDDYIGLDCLGFCSNCANQLLDTPRYRKNATTSYNLFVTPGSKLHKLTEIDITRDLALVYTDVEVKDTGKLKSNNFTPGRHAVLADGSAKTGTNERIVNIVESLGEGTKTGLQTSNQFKIRGDAIGDLFPVTRLSPFKKDTYVFAVRLTK